MNVHTRVDPDDGSTVLAVVGDVEMATSDGLITAFTELAALPSTITVDLAGVTFIDSRGLSALVQIANAAEQGGIPFRLGNPTKRVEQLLQLTGLAGVWPIDRDG